MVIIPQFVLNSSCVITSFVPLKFRIVMAARRGIPFNPVTTVRTTKNVFTFAVALCFRSFFTSRGPFATIVGSRRC